MDTESSTARERSKNFSSDEDRKLREEFTKHAEYLRAPQSNKVTNQGKSDIWKQIADSVTALGHAKRSAAGCKTRWKNICQTAKKTFHEHKRESHRTGGGPPPKAPSASVAATIELLRDTTKFKGIEAGFDTFVAPSTPSSSAGFSSVPTPPNVSFVSVSEEDDLHLHAMDTHEIFSQYGGDDLSKNPLVVLSHEAEEEEVEAAATIKKSPSVAPSVVPSVVPSVASSVAPSSKRKHYDTNASIQLRVLQREEELQRKKDKLLDIEIKT